MSSCDKSSTKIIRLKKRTNKTDIYKSETTKLGLIMRSSIVNCSKPENKFQFLAISSHLVITIIKSWTC